MQKTVIGTEARKKLLAGIETVANTVVVSLGPNGRNVILDKGLEGIVSTKDGVSIARSITKLEDPIENLGAQIIKQASEKSATHAGDGTTTSTCLAFNLSKQGMDLVEKGHNAVLIKRGFDLACKDVTNELEKFSKQISSDKQLNQVASISANNDVRIGNLVAEALNKVGREGVVSVEENKTTEDYLDVVEGMQLDRGYKSPHFVTNNNNMTVVLEKPKILIYNGKITQVKDILTFLEHISSSGSSLLIVAEDIEGEMLASLIVNKMRGILKVCAVKSPGYGDNKIHMLEDLAILTGGKVIDPNKGMKLSSIDLSWLGECGTVTVTKETTTVVDGRGLEEDISKRLEELKTQISEAETPYDREKLQERLAKLVGGVAIISVGAHTEIELKEKKDRIDDALHATQAAIEEGILPGGGVALLRIQDKIKSSKHKMLSKDEEIGYNTLINNLSSPFKQILLNAGFNIEEIENIHSMVRVSKDWMGYNIKTKTITDFMKNGIIDPTKVVRIALENATSVAGTLLLTEACVINIDNKENTQDINSLMDSF